MIDQNIAELLPHDGAMVLLDKVIGFDDKSMVCETTVRSDGLFGNAHTVPAWLGIEYMAQTVAAHDGMMCKIADRNINLGFLLGTRRYLSNVDSFPAGLVLTITVKRIMQDQGLGVFDCQVVGEGVDISAKLNVYQPDSAINKVITE